MPKIFEINCFSKVDHDFDDKIPPDELYGVSFTLISNKYLFDSGEDLEDENINEKDKEKDKKKDKKKPKKQKAIIKKHLNHIIK